MDNINILHILRCDMAKNSYKPIQENNYWDARKKYDVLKESGELFEKDDRMIGVWAYDMKRFLELNDTLQKWDVDVVNPKDQSQEESSGSIWHDKKQE